MTKVFNIALKELRVSFQSPIAYILLCLSLAVFNMFFFIIIDENREATLRDMFTLMEFMFVFIVPLMTMKSIAQENETGTMEFLKTTPTSNTTIILGKYLGSAFFLSLLIVLTFPYLLIINIFGAPDNIAVLTGYFGIWIEGMFFVAVGIMTSSWTKSQVLAAMLSYMIILLLYFSMTFEKYLQGLSLEIISFLNVMHHSENLFSGSLISSDIIYFISGIMLCILISRVSIENRLWQ